MKGDTRLINVRFTPCGKVKRLERRKAEVFVSEGKASYISNSLYKEALGKELTPAQKEDVKHKRKR